MNKWLTTIAMVLGLAVMPAQAATSTFMLVPGIPGESTSDRHAGWIDVVSLTQNLVSRGNGAQCTLNVTKRLDIAGPRLWMAAVTGQNLGQVQIDLVFSGGRDGASTYYRILLSNARVTSISTLDDNVSPSEHLTLSTTSVTLMYWPQRPDGTLGSPVTQTFSC